MPDGQRDALVGAFVGAGPDLVQALAEDQIQLARPQESYLDGGSFDADRMIDRTRSAIASARRDGFSGLRLVVDMGWVVTSQTDLRAVIDYEDRIDGLLVETGTAAICNYGRERFHMPEMRNAECVHQLVLGERDPDGGAPSPLLIERGRGGEIVLRGEADNVSCHSLSRSLAAEVTRTEHLRLDLRDLSFVGAAGMQAIRAAAESVQAIGGDVTLTSPRPAVRQIVDLMGLDRSVTIQDGA